MTKTEQARRADALFYDNVHRAELCHMIARTESERDAAREAARNLFRTLELMEPLAAAKMRKAVRDAGVRV